MTAILSIILFLVMNLLGPGPQPAFPQQAQGNGPSGTILVSTAEVKENERVTMTAFIRPAPGQTMTIESMAFMDPIVWSDLQVTPALPITACGPITLVITGVALREVKSQPVLLIGYNAGNGLESLALAGDWVQIMPQDPPWWVAFFESLNKDVLTGAMVSIVTAFITLLAGEGLRSIHQRRRNLERAHGLLEMLYLQGKEAVIDGKALDMSNFKTLYEAEGLYNVLLARNVNDHFMALWAAASKYNAGLNSSEALHAGSELSIALKRLEAPLDRIEEQCRPWWIRVWIWMARTYRKVMKRKKTQAGSSH